MTSHVLLFNAGNLFKIWQFLALVYHTTM